MTTADAKAKADASKAVEAEVVKCLQELRGVQSEIQGELGPITIFGAVELIVGGDENKKVIVVSFPYRVYMDHVRKIQPRLIAELEKKLRRYVVLIAKRRVLNPINTRAAGMKVRPFSRTLTAVQEALLEDIVAPSEIIGKRTRVRVDGSKVNKIFLDSKDKNKENFADKLDVFSEVYKRLTNKLAVFSLQE